MRGSGKGCPGVGKEGLNARNVELWAFWFGPKLTLPTGLETVVSVQVFKSESKLERIETLATVRTFASIGV